MRKLVFLASVIMLFPIAVMPAEGFFYGAEIGGNSAVVWGDDTPDGVSWRPGMHFGVFMGIELSETIALLPEILYVQGGWKGEVERGDEVVGYETALTYIDIPVLFKITIPKGETARPIILVGPYIGFNLTSEVETDAGTGDLESINTGDYGLVVGAGFDYELFSGAFTFDIRYTLGLADVPDYRDTEGRPLSFKNQSIGFMLGYIF